MFWGNYKSRVLGTEPTNLIQYLILNQTSGSTAVDSSPEGNDGTYSGATLANATGPDGRPVPLFDGVNDHVNVYSAGFDSDWNGQEFTVSLWGKVLNAAVWTDGTIKLMINLHVDADNKFFILKSNVSNEITVQYTASAVDKIINISISTINWFNIIVTVSLASDEMKIFLNGIQQGATITTLGTWIGNLDSSNTVLAAFNTAGIFSWSGWLANIPIWNKTVSAPSIPNLSKI